MWRPSGRLRNPESKSCCEFRLMQIITDIIEYLDERGLLSASDIAYLRQQGFIPTPEEPEHISGAQGAIDHRQAAIESDVFTYATLRLIKCLQELRHSMRDRYIFRAVADFLPTALRFPHAISIRF